MVLNQFKRSLRAVFIDPCLNTYPDLMIFCDEHLILPRTELANFPTIIFKPNAGTLGMNSGRLRILADTFVNSSFVTGVGAVRLKAPADSVLRI